MEEIIDLIATDSAASEVTSKLKDVLFTKAAERIEGQRPTIASSMFADSELEDESEVTSEPEIAEEE
tara:strand:+ start:6385 stop:6585 length:201 start_codon:yes stop_codon:yes gene_type:complete